MTVIPTICNALLRVLVFSALLGFLSGCSGHLADLRENRQANLEKDKQAFNVGPKQLTEPLTLDKAIRIALDRNLDAKVLEMEGEIRQEMLTGAKLKMLPQLNANAELSRRNREYVSSSESFLTGNLSLEPSFSTELTTRKTDISLLWNILDFGVSYYQSKQEESRVKVASQRLRKTRQNLILDITKTYWQAITERQAAAKAGVLIKDLRKRLDITTQQIEGRLVSDAVGLEMATHLVETELKMERFERNYQKHKIQLTTLMGLSQDTKFELAVMELDGIESLQFDMTNLENAALHNRPELFEHDLEENITADEARIELIEMFPSPSLFLRYDRDDNKFLFFNDWWIFGVKAAWNLLSIPQKIKQRDTVLKQQELVRMQRIALGVGILTQLHLSVIDYQDSLRRYQLLENLTRHRTALRDTLKRQASAGKIPAYRHLDSQSKAFFAEARLLDARADVHIALQRIWNAIGQDSRVNTALLGKVMSKEGQKNNLRTNTLPKDKLVHQKYIKNTDQTPKARKNSEIRFKERILLQGNVTYFIVKQGDSLAGISARKEIYGSPLKWPLLFRNNQEKFKGIPLSKSFPQMPVKTDLDFLKIRPSSMANVDKRVLKGMAYGVNVMSSLDAENLSLPAIRLIREGYRAYITTAILNGKQWYRLRIGFYSSRKEAERALAMVKTISGLNNAWLTRIDKEELNEFVSD